MTEQVVLVGHMQNQRTHERHVSLPRIMFQGPPIMSPHYFQETHSGSCCWIRLLNSHLRITITDVTAGTFQICEPGTMSSRTLQINVVTFADVRLKLLTSSITIVLSHPQKFTCLPSRAHLFSAIAINWG